jgi:hypothetical protein
MQSILRAQMIAPSRTISAPAEIPCKEGIDIATVIPKLPTKQVQ